MRKVAATSFHAFLNVEPVVFPLLVNGALAHVLGLCSREATRALSCLFSDSHFWGTCCVYSVTSKVSHGPCRSLARRPRCVLSLAQLAKKKMHHSKKSGGPLLWECCCFPILLRPRLAVPPLVEVAVAFLLLGGGEEGRGRGAASPRSCGWCLPSSSSSSLGGAASPSSSSFWVVLLFLPCCAWCRSSFS